MAAIKRHDTKKHVRFRVEDPKKFKKTSFRIHDIGRPGHTKRIAGRVKKTKKWATQAIILEKPATKRNIALAKGYAKIVKKRQRARGVF